MAALQIPTRKLFKFALLFLLTAGLLVFFSRFSLAAAFTWLKGYPVLALLASIVLNVLLSLAGLLPSVLLTGVNTQVFGLFWGGVISWLGEIAGALVSFLFYRYVLGEEAQSLRRKFPSWDFLNKIEDKSGFRLILTARILPLVPSGLVNLVGALSPLRLWDFLLATALGKIPSLVLETFIGHDLFLWQEKWPRLLVLLALAGIVYLLSGKLVKKGDNVGSSGKSQDLDSQGSGTDRQQ